MARSFIAQLLRPFLRLRALSQGDAHAVSALHHTRFSVGWSEHDIELMLAEQNVHGMGVFAFGHLLGFCLVRTAADEAEILTIATHQWLKGFGLGRMLLHHSFSAAAARRATTMFLEVETGNIPALMLYTRAGFVEVGRRKAYYRGYDGTMHDALILRCPLEALPTYVHGFAGKV